MRVDLTETGGIQAVFQERKGENKASVEELKLALPETGAATVSDIKSVGKRNALEKILVCPHWKDID